MEQNLLCLHFAQDIYQQRGFCTSPFFYISIYHSYKYLHLANWKSVHMCIFSWRICCCTLLCILVSFKVRIKIRNNVDQRSLPTPTPIWERGGENSNVMVILPCIIAPWSLSGWNWIFKKWQHWRVHHKCTCLLWHDLKCRKKIQS